MPTGDINNPNNNSYSPKSVLSAIKTSLYGNQLEPRIDYVDAALSRISSQIISKDARNYAELMRNTLSKSLEKEDYDRFPSNFSNDLDTIGRLNRYLNAEEIVDCITYCARALTVLTDGIISPDDITKQCIQVLPETQSSDQDNESMALVKSIIRELSIDQLAFTIVYETLKLGDQFVEICDYKSGDVPVTQALLTEGVRLTEDDIATLEVKEHVIQYTIPRANNEEEQPEEGEFKLSLVLEIEQNSNDDIVQLLENDNEDDIKTRKTELSDVRVLLHNSINVIKIQSKRHKMCLGYLVVPEFESGVNTMFGGMAGYSGGSPSRGASNFGLSSLMPNSAIVTGIDSLYMDLMSKVKKYIKSDDIFVNKHEVMSLLKKAIGEMDTDQPADQRNVPFRVRFVPVNRMEHFCISSHRFFPYGESIFFKTTFQAKLLIALETAITIKRISDSVDKRIIYVETGLPRDARNVIEDLKNAFKKRKFSIDSLGTIGTIPSSITAYEDIYIPQSKGKRFVEFDTLQSNIQIRDVVEELKLFRDMIVGSLQVPPAFLNIEENLCCSTSTAIPLVDGRTLSLLEIIEEFNENKENWVYSYNPESEGVFPNRVKWAGHTRQNAEMVRVWLSNNEYVDATPDHKFMMKTGEYKEAKDLTEGESLMPNYIYQLDNYQSNHMRDLEIYKVETLQEKMNCGDIEVEKYHNFAVSAGVIVHNSNKSALTFENSLFAQTITAYQFQFSKMLHSFISKISMLVNKKRIKESVIITFPPPKMLQMERDAEKYDMVARIVQALVDMGVNKDWAVKKYVDLPWDDIKTFGIKHSVDQKINPPDQNDMMGGMGGGIGGGMPAGFG